jgi:hypothetical protein
MDTYKTCFWISFEETRYCLHKCFYSININDEPLQADKISLPGVDHGITCTCIEGKIYIRGYALKFSKSEESKVRDPSNPLHLCLL